MILKPDLSRHTPIYISAVRKPHQTGLLYSGHHVGPCSWPPPLSPASLFALTLTLPNSSNLYYNLFFFFFCLFLFLSRQIKKTVESETHGETYRFMYTLTELLRWGSRGYSDPLLLPLIWKHDYCCDRLNCLYPYIMFVLICLTLAARALSFILN